MQDPGRDVAGPTVKISFDNNIIPSYCYNTVTIQGHCKLSRMHPGKATDRNCFQHLEICYMQKHPDMLKCLAFRILLILASLNAKKKKSHSV